MAKRHGNDWNWFSLGTICLSERGNAEPRPGWEWEEALVMPCHGVGRAAVLALGMGTGPARGPRVTNGAVINRRLLSDHASLRSDT